MIATAHETKIGAALAGLLAYPDASLPDRVEVALRAGASYGTKAVDSLWRFAAAVAPLSEDEREELYTRTFDINPVGALEIGWHLFGEDYHRGALLVRLRMELRRHGIEEAGELPDHLTRVLTLLDRMAADEAGEFAGACVLPAVEKMLDGFGGKDNPYEHLLRCVSCVLATRFGKDPEGAQRLEPKMTPNGPRKSLPIIDAPVENQAGV
jgi:nitrate reductase delta subunit